MMHTLTTRLPVFACDLSRWCLLRLLLPLFDRRRRMRAVSERSRRQRMRTGYGYIPQRVWDRHSALFIDD